MSVVSVMQAAEAIEVVEDIIRRKIDPHAVVVQLRQDGDGFGVVLYTRTGYDDRYVVHRWATKDTAGEPIPGGMLYSGGYHETYWDAVADFDARPRGH